MRRRSRGRRADTGPRTGPITGGERRRRSCPSEGAGSGWKGRGCGAGRGKRRRCRAELASRPRIRSRRLEDVKLVALMIDGIEVARQTVVVGLGISEDGTKTPLGLWQGSTENAALCTALLQDLLGRGL